jgi:hypothetical protein
LQRDTLMLIIGAADANDDGVVNIADIIFILNGNS